MSWASHGPCPDLFPLLRVSSSGLASRPLGPRVVMVGCWCFIFTFKNRRFSVLLTKKSQSEDTKSLLPSSRNLFSIVVLVYVQLHKTIFKHVYIRVCVYITLGISPHTPAPSLTCPTRSPESPLSSTQFCIYFHVIGTNVVLHIYKV